MNNSIKRFYISYLTKTNFKTYIRKIKQIVYIDEFFTADQTIGNVESAYLMSDDFEYLDSNEIYDWRNDDGKVLSKLDKIKADSILRKALK